MQVVKKHRELVLAANFISVSLDEATACDNTNYMSVHVHVIVNWTRVPLFVKLKMVAGSATADNLLRLLDSLSEVLDISREVLLSKLVALGTDGAAVMTGAHTGLAAQHRNHHAPFMLAIHCAAHRLQLSSGAIRDDPLVSAVMACLARLNTHFCKSPQRQAIYETGEPPAPLCGLVSAFTRCCCLANASSCQHAVERMQAPAS